MTTPPILSTAPSAAMIQCFECKGTGSSVPDCPLCKGYQTVKAKRAYAYGWKKSDLVDLEDDGYCECPQCYDTARTCVFCAGGGQVSQFVEGQQRDRILITALGGFRGTIAPCFKLGYHDHRVEVADEIYLLSKEYVYKLRDQGLLHCYCSIFGDEIYLTQAGHEEAKKSWKAYRAICRQWVKDERERRVERKIIETIHIAPRIIEDIF